MKKTYLNSFHSENGGSMVDFAGWHMPVNYGSQINEHNLVRSDVGIFDVSHMAVFDFHGKNQTSFLQHLLPNDIAKILPNKRALYSPLLNNAGGILDDLIVYHLGDEKYRIISNCATREQNFEWFKEIAANFSVEVIFHSEASIIALQGPKSQQIIKNLYDLELGNFELHQSNDLMIARTGYTGEVGFELISDQEVGKKLWHGLIEEGVQPIGLAARDTLRLEAGLNLYGSDMTVSNNPFDSNLSWTVDTNNINRNFIGAEALKTLSKPKQVLCGFFTNERGVLRAGSKITFNGGDGVVTSGTWSPTFKKNIGFCRIDANHPSHGIAKLRDKEINLEFCETNFLKYLK